MSPPRERSRCAARVLGLVWTEGGVPCQPRCTLPEKHAGQHVAEVTWPKEASP